MRLSVLLLICSVVALFGCSSSGSSRSVRPYQIQLAEIKGSSARTAFDLIQQHRPGWLRESDRDYEAYARGARRTGFVVYVDGQRYGQGASALSSITSARIHQIDYLDAGEALSRLGRGHEEGAVRIVTRSHKAAKERTKSN